MGDPGSPSACGFAQWATPSLRRDQRDEGWLARPRGLALTDSSDLVDVAKGVGGLTLVSLQSLPGDAELPGSGTIVRNS